MNTYGILIIIVTLLIISAVYLLALQLWYPATILIIIALLLGFIGHSYVESRVWLSLVGVILLISCILFIFYLAPPFVSINQLKT